MKTAEEVAAGLVALCGRHPVGLLAEVAHALDEYARAFHEARLREALGAAGVDGARLADLRGWVEEGTPRVSVLVTEVRVAFAALDHCRDLACAMRHDNGYRDGWEAGLKEGVRRCVDLLKTGRDTGDWEWLCQRAGGEAR